MHANLGALAEIAYYGRYWSYNASQLETLRCRRALFCLRARPPPDTFGAILSIVPALPAPPARNPLLRFWRGGYSLAVSFWLIGLGLYGLGIAAILGLTILIYREPYDPQVIALAIFGTWAVTGPILFYQSVGVWRAARRSRAADLRSRWRWLCTRLAQLSVLAV